MLPSQRPLKRSNRKLQLVSLARRPSSAADSVPMRPSVNGASKGNLMIAVSSSLANLMHVVYGVVVRPLLSAPKIGLEIYKIISWSTNLPLDESAAALKALISTNPIMQRSSGGSFLSHAILLLTPLRKATKLSHTQTV